MGFITTITLGILLSVVIYYYTCKKSLDEDQENNWQDSLYDDDFDDDYNDIDPNEN